MNSRGGAIKKGVHGTPFFILFCGADGVRTRDLLRDRQAL